MLYLEDYLEMIEHLPQELRDRFTEMREMDLQVQNSADSLEKQVKVFFSKAKKLKQTERDVEHATILKDYYKALEIADEKVQLASQIFDLVDRYLRRLDQELHKFKMELEADNKGITEILEKRSLDLDQPVQSAQKENRYSLGMQRTQAEKRSSSGTLHALIEKKMAVERTVGGSSSQHQQQQHQQIEARPISNSMAMIPVQQQVNFSLSHIGAGSSAIAAAASQAIAATQQGRRTASLKASYEAINTGINPHELSIGRELAGAAQSAIAAAILPEQPKKQKSRRTSTAASMVNSPANSTSSTSAMTTSTMLSMTVEPSPPAVATDEVYENITDGNAESSDWAYDPNEPRYCFCNQVSYGDMVACDNEDCPFEWFHYPCVNITAPPKGKWYCPRCTTSMKRRGSRK
ncbi:inhibitor of growth protein 3-like isoform X2 [Neocloeon triangulifer]|uniref:inhibitor of growth protein 3-like isoform X2 n=1 Tax=Neocloeon triangulifer TaxID=2078957 RepID=UPI00286ECCDE|nr:inhibitor of growth protein 3-like isoform X2 [Neocloeon triangulifer]